MKLKGLFLIGATSLLLIACNSNNKAESSSSVASSETSSSVSEVAEKPQSGYYFKDSEIVIRDLKIKITDHKVIKPGDAGNEYGDKPIIAFWYDTTNLSDKEITPGLAWMAVFTVVQDNNPNSVNKLESAGLPDSQFQDSQFEDIKKDGTVSHAVAYELDDDTTPVTLIGRQGPMGDKLGEQIFEIK